MRVRQAVSINAPVDQAFAYLNDPENSLALIPSLVEVREIAPLANGGHRLRFVALGRGGKRWDSESEQIERIPNRLVVVHARTDDSRRSRPGASRSCRPDRDSRPRSSTGSTCRGRRRCSPRWSSSS
jgi:hypothetical protein